MKWRDIGLSAKFTIGFGIVIVLLGVVVGWTIIGIQGIVDNAGEVIDGNEVLGQVNTGVDATDQ